MHHFERVPALAEIFAVSYNNESNTIVITIIPCFLADIFSATANVINLIHHMLIPPSMLGIFRAHTHA
jgi:hypothetical protein